MTAITHPFRLGLRANGGQFALLILINAFVGAMLGLERTLVPLIAGQEFGLTSVSVTLSFIISFGVVKALANLVAGRSADRWGSRSAPAQSQPPGEGSRGRWRAGVRSRRSRSTTRRR